MTQFCIINNEKIYVNDYINNINNINNNNNKIVCQKGHELILVNGEKNIPHFRHKNSYDVGGNPMTFWHVEWQSYFPITEICFSCKPNQIKNRRADVLLNEKKILEIQHSKCDKKEIDNRKHDYNLHQIDIIWLINGNKNIDVKKLEYSNRVYLEFTTDYWKYESFTSYDYIFIDINSIIYKINPNKVKSHMIDVENGKTKEEFIESLKNDIDIWENNETEQCNLFIKQQGAGNGKTYGIIKMLEDDDKCHYKNFIYITKQHSAKHIIKTEFERQKNNFQYLKNIEIIEYNKKYIIKYFNEKSGQNCQIIIATIDSFTYSIGNKNHDYFDKFEGLIYSIIDGYIESKICGTINLGGVSPKLNKENLLVVDEFQDAKVDYAKAIVQIMRNKYIDVFIVGDRLQSIISEKNAFTYFWENEFPLINIIKLEPTNNCIRFDHPTFIEFVNSMIPFKKYGLPEIKPYKEYTGEELNPIIFFTRKEYIDYNINTEDNHKKIIAEVKQIMEYYINEVNENKRLPEDFLIITPFTIKNPIVDALLLAINIFWKNKFINEPEYMSICKNYISIDEYYRYAIFHKSEEGKSIDLSESEYSTRIVSCHSSKGDGRNVVFIIGLNESAIKKFSQFSNNLVYDSLFHVSITRMKEKLYIHYQNNNDDIAIKINKYRKNNTNYQEYQEEQKEILPYINDINYRMGYDKIVCNDKNESYNLFKNIINNTNLTKIIENKDEKQIIDMGNHIIRYSALYINILLEIVNREKKIYNLKIKKQIIAILNVISKCEIVEVNNFESYYKLLNKNNYYKLLSKNDNITEIPIIKISNKGKDYINYFYAIIQFANHVKRKIKFLLNNNEEIILCPFECIILYYMIEIICNKYYSIINIVDIYDIVDLYNNSFESDKMNGHDNCLCKNYFNKIDINNVNNKKIASTKLYIYKHYEKINHIKHIMSLFYEKYPQMNWLIFHNVIYNGNNNNFIIKKKFDLICYDENKIIIVYIKPQFNLLNYNEILLDSIFDTYLINNVKKYKENDENDENDEISENYKRFNGKKIITCIFSLDMNEPYYIEWNDTIKNNYEIIKNKIYFNIIEKYKLETNNLFYFYKYYRLFCPESEKSPSNFIRFLKEKFSKFNKLPKYIDEFLCEIEFEIQRSKCKKNKKLILKKYDNNEYYAEKLEEKLEINVKRYLGIKIDDDTDDDTNDDTDEDTDDDTNDDK